MDLLADMITEAECLEAVHQTQAKEDRKANLDVEIHFQLPEDHHWIDGQKDINGGAKTCKSISLAC